MFQRRRTADTHAKTPEAMRLAPRVKLTSLKAS
jgi:hypothetical protein